MAIEAQQEYGANQGELNLGVGNPRKITEPAMAERLARARKEAENVAARRSAAARPAKGDKLSIADSLAIHLGSLARMVSNITESFSTCIFISDPSGSYLTLVASHSLGNDVIPHAKVPFGSGLVGWTAQNRSRIIVAPFEQSSASLLYYSGEQQLKSFIAVPIPAEDGTLLGVLSCDSKKNYAFAKVTEKVLADCADQAAFIISSIFRGVKRGAPTHGSSNSSFAAQYDEDVKNFIGSLDECRTETDLLNRVLQLPNDIAPRDALVIVTAADTLGGEPRTLSAPGNNLSGAHRLLELVCRHKPVICADRSVQVENNEGSAGRTFLSVPFKVLRTEAGSLNLLSQPGFPFSSQHTTALEQICKAIGKHIEAIRLRTRVAKPDELEGVLTWENFVLRTRAITAGPNKNNLALWRMEIGNTNEIESLFDLGMVERIRTRILRALTQSIATCGFVGTAAGNQILVMCEASKLERARLCFQKLIERGCLEGVGVSNSNGAPLAHSSAQSPAKVNQRSIAQLVLNGLKESIVNSSKNSNSFEDLLRRSMIADDRIGSKSLTRVP